MCGYLEHSLWNCLQINATKHFSRLFNITWGDGLMASATSTWTNVDQVILRHIASLDPNRSKQYFYAAGKFYNAILVYVATYRNSSPIVHMWINSRYKNIKTHNGEMRVPFSEKRLSSWFLQNHCKSTVSYVETCPRIRTRAINIIRPQPHGTGPGNQVVITPTDD